MSIAAMGTCWPRAGRARMLASLALGALLLGTVEAAEAQGSWRGTVKVDGMIHEPGGYHPYTATIRLHLREGERSVVPGGFRVALVSEGSVNDVQTEVHQTSGLLLCSGTGTEELPDRTMGYLETKAGATTYHLLIARAFGAFACGRNRAIKRDRSVIIGLGDPEAAEIETSDTVRRALEDGDSAMNGAFHSTRKRDAVSYEYKISWSVTRACDSGSAL